VVAGALDIRADHCYSPRVAFVRIGEKDDLADSVNETAFTSGEVAGICAVSKTTVARWIASGKVSAFQTPGGHRRVRVADLYKFLLEFRIPIPPQVLQALEKT
jgi:excisionase family DNA binding protein